MAKIGCIILGIAAVLLLAVLLVTKKVREKRLEELTLYLMKLQDEPELPKLQSFSEGKLGILESEIYKLVALYYENSAHIGRENAYLSKMLSDISHQIKTPLTSITIMADLLKEPELSREKRLEFAGRIDQQVNRITWLVKNLLTLSQLEADVLKLKKEDVSMSDLMEKAVEPFRVMADIRDVELNMEMEADIHVICDAHWTAEAISNIVKNCLEHTPPGGKITMSAKQSNLSTSLFIRDNGEGIDKEELGHIFERFYKGRNASVNSVGIGLALSKQIMMQQNGVIEVKSEPGAGTQFQMKWYHGFAGS